MLYDKAIQIARQRNADYIWLGVWEENHKALRFYRKNGFVEFDKHIFKLGDSEQTDFMMKFDLAGMINKTDSKYFSLLALVNISLSPVTTTSPLADPEPGCEATAKKPVSRNLGPQTSNRTREKVSAEPPPQVSFLLQYHIVSGKKIVV